MVYFNVTEDIKYRASKGLLTNKERQQMKDEILWHRKRLIRHRKILEDLILENTKVKFENLL